MYLSQISEEKLRAAFDIYIKEYCVGLPDNKELANITFSEKFEIKMKRLIATQKKSYYYMVNTVRKKVAIIVIAIIVSLTATTFSVKAIRDAVIEFITTTFEKFTQITVDMENTVSQVDFQQLKPEYIPDGFVLERETYIENEIYHITYISSQKQSITYMQQTQRGSGMKVDTEKTEIKTIYINSFEGMAYNNKGYNTIVFADENYYFMITSEVSTDELQKIAESIPLK